MKVKLKTIMAGPDVSYQPGDEVVFDKETAQALIAAGFAETLPGSELEEGAPTGDQEPTDQNQEEENRPLDEMTLAELRDLAKKAGIDGSRMNKATLIKALTTDEKG